MEDAMLPIHTIIFAVSFVGIIIAVVQIYLHKELFGYILLPLTYLVDVFLYNFVLHATFIWGADWLSLSQLEFWSGVVRLHSLFLIIALIVFQPRVKKDDRYRDA